MIESNTITIKEPRQLNYVDTFNQRSKSKYYNKESRLNRLNNHKNNSSKLTCPECGSTNIIKDAQTFEFLCECGCVVDEDLIDMGPDWRNFKDSNKDNSHIGRPKAHDLHDGGLGSDFLVNKNVPYDERMKILRLKRWHNRSRISSNYDRHLSIAFTKLRFYISSLSLSRDIQTSAAKYYRKLLDLNVIHGRSIESMVASCVYVVCSEFKISRTFDEISEVSGVKAKDIAKYAKLIRKQLNIKYAPTSPNEYIPRFISNLELSADVEILSLEIASKLKNSIGAKPSVLAAVSIYLACDKLSKKITQVKISEATNVSATTIRNWKRKVENSFEY